MKIIEVNLSHNGGYQRRGTTDELVLHHAEASHASVEDINRWHNGRGWNGIGYHYYIRKDGSVYRGRPEWAVGAHAVNHNSRSIGICCEGAYMTETMPAAQLDSLLALIRDVQGRYGNRLALKRHKDVGSTDCPGDNFPWAEAQKWNATEEDVSMTQEQFNAMYEKVNPTYTSIEQVPKYWQEETRELMQIGAIQGDGKNKIAIRQEELQAAVIAYRVAVAMTRDMGIAMQRCKYVSNQIK